MEETKPKAQKPGARKPETYAEQKARHTKELNDFPMFFAFNNEQFNEGMRKFGLSPDETDKILSYAAGGYILKADAPKLTELLHRQAEELRLARKYKGFAINAFVYELANHEYVVTRNPTDTLRSLGLTDNDLAVDKKLNGMFAQAVKRYLSDCAAAEDEAVKPRSSFLGRLARNQETVEAGKEARQANPPDVDKNRKKSGQGIE